MKKLWTLGAMLTVSAWFAGCGESTPPATKTPSPAVQSGAPAGHKAEGDKAEGEKEAEGEKAATEGEAAGEKSEGEAAGSEEKAPE